MKMTSEAGDSWEEDVQIKIEIAPMVEETANNCSNQKPKTNIYNANVINGEIRSEKDTSTCKDKSALECQVVSLPDAELKPVISAGIKNAHKIGDKNYTLKTRRKRDFRNSNLVGSTSLKEMTSLQKVDLQGINKHTTGGLEVPGLVRINCQEELSNFCTVCGKAFSKPRGLRLHLKVHEEGKPHKCDVCDKTFARQVYLKSHQRTHTGARPFKCKHCDLTFTQSGNLQSHLRVHTGEKPFVCSVCDKGFTISSHLRIHMRVHTGEKPYTCETCGKNFRFSNHMRAHVRSHTGERPFQCEACGRGFTTSCGLREHTRTHTGERPYRCPFTPCDKAFASFSTLQTHKRTHTGVKPYLCPTCGKNFMRSGDLQRHKITHTGERRHKCDICNKTYTQAGHLQNHMRMHLGIRPFICEYCGKTFTRSDRLSDHKRTRWFCQGVSGALDTSTGSDEDDRKISEKTDNDGVKNCFPSLLKSAVIEEVMKLKPLEDKAPDPT